MDNSAYYTNVVQHPDGSIKLEGIGNERSCKWIAVVIRGKYPNSQVETMRVYGLTSCWHCGDPIIFIDKNVAENHYQKNDKLTCSEFCEAEKRDHYK